jgi:hypothetical protein
MSPPVAVRQHSEQGSAFNDVSATAHEQLHDVLFVFGVLFWRDPLNQEQTASNIIADGPPPHAQMASIHNAQRYVQRARYERSDELKRSSVRCKDAVRVATFMSARPIVLSVRGDLPLGNAIGAELVGNGGPRLQLEPIR